MLVKMLFAPEQRKKNSDANFTERDTKIEDAIERFATLL